MKSYHKSNLGYIFVYKASLNNRLEGFVLDWFWLTYTKWENICYKVQFHFCSMHIHLPPSFRACSTQHGSLNSRRGKAQLFYYLSMTLQNLERSRKRLAEKQTLYPLGKKEDICLPPAAVCHSSSRLNATIPKWILATNTSWAEPKARGHTISRLKWTTVLACMQQPGRAGFSSILDSVHACMQFSDRWGGKGAV